MPLTRLLLAVHALLLTAAARLGSDREDRERGDVPGWVMVTILSAAIVVALIAVAPGKLSDLFGSSVNRVSTTTTSGG